MTGQHDKEGLVSKVGSDWSAWQGVTGQLGKELMVSLAKSDWSNGDIPVT